MTYVLDTNMVSFLMKGDAGVERMLRSVPRTEVFLVAPVIAEIEYGLARLPRSARRDRLRATFEGVLAEIRRAAWTDEVSAIFGDIKADLERRGARLEDMDIAVAAHARALDAVLVTGNLHMRRVRGLRLEDWSAHSAGAHPGE